MLSALDQIKLQVMGDAIDTLITVDFHGRGLVRPVYEILRKKIGVPLTYHAARGLYETVRGHESVVLIGTGFLVPPAVYPETDGPIAAALLARALDILGCKSFIVCEREVLPCLKGACVAAELSPFENSQTALSIPHSVGLITLPADKREFATVSAGIFDSLQPKAMVSIEHPGQNAEGRYHAAFGHELPGWVAPVDVLLKQVMEKGGFTIGIGDLGNEAGLGNAQPEIRDAIPFGDKIATIIPSSAPIMSVVSEMGTYGLIAALSAVTGKMLLHDVRLQEAVTRQAVLSGAVDGVSGKREASADLIDIKYLNSFIELLHAILVYTEMHSRARPYCLEFIQNSTNKIFAREVTAS